MAQKLPLGMQSFRYMREHGYLYVDKTERIYGLFSQGKYYFLSRPRRFGKSLLLSTLDAIFSGQKEYFQGLWLEQSEYDWKEHPVILIDFSALSTANPEQFLIDFRAHLRSLAQQFEVEVSDEEISPAQIWYQLIEGVYRKHGSVVVLVDEYDRPLVSNLDNLEAAEKFQLLLRDFYSVLKSLDEQLRFVFLTGVSKFSRLPVFSGLNNLTDITLQPRFADLLGYTQQELEQNFVEHIQDFARKEGGESQDILDKMRYWYNGYRFSRSDISVYNPYSTLQALHFQSFDDYWFQSGTPTLLVSLIKQRNFNLQSLDEQAVQSDEFESFDLETLQLKPLLFQTGYLTIKDFQPELEQYHLGYPNYEVKKSFLRKFLDQYVGSEKLPENFLSELIISLQHKDVDRLFLMLKSFFASIPYTLHIAKERYYQTIFYALFSLAGTTLEVEVTINQGRIDVVIFTKQAIYVLEFKLGGSAQQALQQIRERNYAERYGADSRQKFLIGVNFDLKRGQVEEYLVEAW